MMATMAARRANTIALFLLAVVVVEPALVME